MIPRNMWIAWQAVLSALFAAFIASTPAKADTYNLDFTQTSFLDPSSNGVWNVSQGRLQARPSVTAGTTTAMDFGGGTDGAFNDGATASGITTSGAIITLDTGTTTPRVYEFTTFNLSSGKEVRAIGTNPLVIKVMGSATVSGVINLAGATGGSNAASGPVSGAIAFAKGGNGGIGGAIAAGDNSTAGVNAGNESLGGGKGVDNSLSLTYSGGGGGCNGKDGTNDATAGVSSGGSAAAAGACITARNTLAQGFTDANFRGGAGGGGGGAYEPGGAGQVSGASGGAGGGALKITAAGNISITGTITAKGGDGGAADLGTAPDCGGGGGGGAGGSVWLQTGGTLSGTGTLNVAGGTGGTSVTCGTFSDGGNGSRGIIRADSAGATPSIPTLPASSISHFNAAIPSGGTFTILSKAIDLGSSRDMEFTTPEITQGCGSDGTLNVTFEGSDDGVNFGSGVAAAEINSLKGNAFVRFRTTIKTTGPNPPCLTGLSLTRPAELSNLQLRGGLFCGSIDSGSGGGKGGPTSPLAAAGDMTLIALAAWMSRRLTAQMSRRLTGHMTRRLTARSTSAVSS